jgi:hypothetical protein
MMPAGYCHLIREILMLTRSDLKIDAKKKGLHFMIRQDALSFIQTEWFEFLCIAMDLNAEPFGRSFFIPRILVAKN